MPTPTPAGRNDEIRRRLLAHESIIDIARAFDLTPRRVAQIANQQHSRAGDATLASKARRAYIEERDADIHRRLRAHEPATHIARELGISEGTVRYVALRDGLHAPRMAKTSTKPAKPEMSQSDAHAYLERAVARECAMPWERHPQPQR